MHQKQDYELVSDLKTGSHEDMEKSMKEIFRRYWPFLKSHATRFLRKNGDDGIEAEDLVQTVFSELWHKRKSLNIENLRAYLSTSIRYRAVSYLTRKNKTRRLDDFEYDIHPTTQPMKEIVCKDQFNHAIEGLRSKEQNVFIEHYLEGRSTEDLAKEMKVKDQTMQGYLNDVRQAIRDKFGKKKERKEKKEKENKNKNPRD